MVASKRLPASRVAPPSTAWPLYQSRGVPSCGRRRSRCGAPRPGASDRTHPFGYGKDIYFWAFAVSVNVRHAMTATSYLSFGKAAGVDGRGDQVQRRAKLK
jgi:hypothetical protein